MSKFICKASGNNADESIGIMSVQIKAVYTFTIVTLISASLNDVATYVFLGLDFVMNLTLTFRIIRLHQQVSSSNLGIQETQKKRSRQ